MILCATSAILPRHITLQSLVIGLQDLTNGPDDGHGGILGDWDISRVAEVAEGLPVGDLGHPVLLGAGVELGTVDTLAQLNFHHNDNQLSLL